METLEGLSDALATTEDIQSIVRTMKSLSAVSIRQFEQAEMVLADYERTIELGLIALLRAQRWGALPMPMATTGHKEDAVIVIGSDRGLCGGYNDTIARFATGHISDDTGMILAIGARAAAALDAAGHAPNQVFAQPGSVAGLTPLVQSIILEIDQWTRERGITRVRLFHNRRRRGVSAVPRTRTVLPMSDATLTRLSRADWPGPGLPFFRMDRAALLSQLIQHRLFVLIYRALAEALASEHATRLAAMQSAERNIRDRKDDLTTRFRRKRQETITRELLDVIAGFQAVGQADPNDQS